MKCDICNEKIEEMFLGKIRGIYIKKDKKNKTVCSDCQKEYKNDLSEKLK